MRAPAAAETMTSFQPRRPAYVSSRSSRDEASPRRGPASTSSSRVVGKPPAPSGFSRRWRMGLSVAAWPSTVSTSFRLSDVTSIRPLWSVGISAMSRT